jgi:hypothetical protein
VPISLVFDEIQRSAARFVKEDAVDAFSFILTTIIMLLCRYPM